MLNPLVVGILWWTTVHTNRCTFSLGHCLAAHQDGAVSAKVCVYVCVYVSINETERGGDWERGVEQREGGREGEHTNICCPPEFSFLLSAAVRDH